MVNNNDSLDQKTATVVGISIRLAFVALLVLLSVQILAPFLMPIFWGVIVAVGVYPLFLTLVTWFRGSKKLAATFIVVVFIAVLVVPLAALISNMSSNVEKWSNENDIEELHLPVPPSQVKDWPVIGEDVYKLWENSSRNIEFLVEKIKPYVADAIPVVLSKAMGIIGVVLQLIISIIIAGLLLVNAESGKELTINIFKTVIGKDGEGFVELSQNTILGVVQGILGTAFLQTIFLGLGMYLINVPAYGVWAFLVLIVAIIQLPPTLIMLPVIIYVFNMEDVSTTVAVIFSIWSIVWSLADSVLKPILMGRGVDIPMLVIFLGAIGGMMAFGIIGLFVGAIVLAITYKVVIAITANVANQEK